MPPERGHNREISQRNDFFIMSIGHQMNENLIEQLMQDAANAAALQAPQPQPEEPEPDNRFIYDSEDDDDEPMVNDESYEDRTRIFTRNATIVLIRNMQAYIRFHRVDVHRVENTTGATSTTASMRTRLEDMETMIEAFEDNIIRNTLQPRQLFQD